MNRMRSAAWFTPCDCEQKKPPQALAGSDWVRTYEGELTPDALARVLP